MKLHSLILFLAVSIGGLFAPKVANAQVYSNYDLETLGRAWYFNDADAAMDIEDDDLYFFAIGMIDRDDEMLDNIVSDDLYFAGRGMLAYYRGDYDDAEEFITNISNDDWYFFVAAFLDDSEEVMDLIEDDRIYFLGLAMLTDNEYQLDNIPLFDPPSGSSSGYDVYDLYYVGKAFINRDASYADQILDDDLYYFARGITEKDEIVLDNVISDDIYYAGMAILSLGDSMLVEEYLDMIIADDWYFFGAGFQDESEAVFDLIESDALYYLGTAMFYRSESDLEYVLEAEDDYSWDEGWDEPNVYHYYTAEDCYNMGMYMITGDKRSIDKVTDNDLKLMAKAVYTGDKALLDQINDDDIYYTGMAILTYPENSERAFDLMDNIISDDWYFFASAICYESIEDALLIYDDELYYLCYALVNNDTGDLDYLIED